MKYYITAKYIGSGWFGRVYHYDKTGNKEIPVYSGKDRNQQFTRKEDAIDDAAEWFENSQYAECDSETEF